MKIEDFCKSYFKAIPTICNYKQQSFNETLLAVVELISYLTIFIPVGVSLLYSSCLLKGRIKHCFSSPDLAQLEKIANTYQVCKGPISFAEVKKTYAPKFLQQANANNLTTYSQSAEYQRHAKSARIYYNAAQLSKKDAQRVIFQREPTNIAMGANQYKENELNNLFGYKKGIYNTPHTKKEDGTYFKDLPNTASVYAETYLWKLPGSSNKIEIACLSVPAPALDSPKQPHYAYYMKTGQLDQAKYRTEMHFLFKSIEQAVRDNKDSAFESKGIQRVVLSRFGQGAFLNALNPTDQATAKNIYNQELLQFLNSLKDLKLTIVMSEFKDPGGDRLLEVIEGDIIETAEEGDLIINAWDPHSAPGNGNDADASFDGAMGKASGIILTQTSWLNQHLKDDNSLRPVKVQI